MKKGEALFGLILFLSVLVLAAGLLFPNSHESDLAGLAIDQSVANLAKLPKCTNASCVSPPSPFCNGSKLITYEIPGICASNKKCSYTKFSVDCPLGCNNGACVFKDVCSSDSILGTVDDGAASKPGTNSFALFVNPVVKNENTKYSLYFDKSIQVNTEKLTKQMGNAVSYSDNGVVLEFDAKNANPFMLTKFGDDNIRQASFDGYIIELVEEPIAKKKANIEKKVKKLKQDINELSDSEAASSANLNILNNKRSELDKIERSSEQELIAQESRIEQEQLKFIDDLSNVIEKKRKAKAEKPQRVQMVHAKKRFKNSFNGVFIQDVSEDELLEIKKLKTVKRITPNFRVSIDLQESVPIIRADKLWETGITGNGVGIGIIDTGVDYSHPDLNGCSGSGDSHAESTLKIGGRDYKVISSSGIGVNDFNIKVDISGDGVLPNFNLGDNFRDVIGSEKETITKDDYLFLKDFGMLQYKGADKITADNPLLKFKQLKTGNTTEQTYTNSSPLAKLKLGGYDYSVFAVSDMVFNDFDINADLDHSGYIDYGISIIADESKDIVKDNNFYLLDYDGLLQYLGADKATNDNPIMRFKNLQTGEIIEQSYAIISSGGGGGGGGNSSNTSIPSTEPTNPKTGGGFGSGCKVEGGYDFVNNDNDPIDDNGHGTHVAATAAGNGVLKGVAPDATIYAYKVLDSGGSGTFANIIAAIERSIDPNQDKDFSDHLDVISLSLGAYCGFYDEGCGPDDPLSTAIDNAVNEGVIAVVAAGNAGPSPGTIASPGTSRKAITVGASCKPNPIGKEPNPYCGQPIASFSSRGPVEWSGNIISKPDISAPGVAICAAEWDDAFNYAKCLDDNHVAISGTSMATPHIAGAAALLKQSHNDWNPDDIKSALMIGAKDLGLETNTQGAGLANVEDSNKAELLISPFSLTFGTVVETLPKPINVTVKNTGNKTLKLFLFSDCGVASIQPQMLVIKPMASKSFLFSLNKIPEREGAINGHVYILNGAELLQIPYSFRALSQLTMMVESGNKFSTSDYSIVDEKLKFVDFRFGAGSNYSFFVPSGKYVVFAAGDVIDFGGNEYLLAKDVAVPKHKNIKVPMSTQNIKPFSIKAKSFDNEALVLYEWQKAFRVFNDRGCFLSYDLTDPNYGDRTVYVSNKPNTNLDMDVFFKFNGVPSKTAPQAAGSGSSRGFSWNIWCN